MRRVAVALMLAVAVLHWTARPAPEPTEYRPVDLSRPWSTPAPPPVTDALPSPSIPAPTGPPNGTRRALLDAERRYVERPSPKPAPSQGATVASAQGIASWFASHGPGLYAAAGPGLRVGKWRGRVVTVCTSEGRCLGGVRIIDWCQCLKGQGNRERLVDLSRDAFARLAEPSLGLLSVEVRW